MENAGCISGIARVWINGALAAVNRNGYMGFSVDLKPWISYENENIIRIDVDNSNSLTADGIQVQEFTEMSICGPEKMYIFHMISCVLQHCQ